MTITKRIKRIIQYLKNHYTVGSKRHIKPGIKNWVVINGKVLVGMGRMSNLGKEKGDIVESK